MYPLDIFIASANFTPATTSGIGLHRFVADGSLVIIAVDRLWDHWSTNILQWLSRPGKDLACPFTDTTSLTSRRYLRRRHSVVDRFYPCHGVLHVSWIWTGGDYRRSDVPLSLGGLFEVVLTPVCRIFGGCVSVVHVWRIYPSGWHIRNFDEYGDARYTHAPGCACRFCFCNGCCGCGVESGILGRVL